MEKVDEGSATTAPAAEKTSVNRNALFVFYLMKKGGFKKNKMPVNSFDELTLEGLKLNVAEELGKWEWTDGNDKPEKFDILHRCRAMSSDEDVKRLGPFGAIMVISKDRQNNKEEHHRSEKFIVEYIKSNKIMGQVGYCKVALRLALSNPKFVSMVENLGKSEKLENILERIPELKNDPVGIGIIQDPFLILHLSDLESLTELAKNNPWVIEAFIFLSNPIYRDQYHHYQQHSGPPQEIPHLMFDLIDLALAAVDGASQPPPTSQQQLPPSASSNPNPTDGNLMNTLTLAGGSDTQPLNNEMVARAGAGTDALRPLTPEQREDQLNVVRNMTAGGTQSQSNLVTLRAPTTSLQQRQGASGSLAQQYGTQLQQMQNLGITDERLSMWALRVSEGDVRRAVELLLSEMQRFRCQELDTYKLMSSNKLGDHHKP